MSDTFKNLVTRMKSKSLTKSVSYMICLSPHIVTFNCSKLNNKSLTLFFKKKKLDA